jgi:uncharacterized protein (TIRG00374 family)
MAGRRPAGLKRLAVALIGIAVSVVALVIVFRSVNLEAALDAFRAAEFAWLVPAFGVLVVGFVLRLVRWDWLLPLRADGTRAPVLRILPCLFIGYLGNVILPARLGEPIRAYLVSRRESIAFGGVFGSVVLERIIDTVVLAVLAFVASVRLDAPEWVRQGTAILSILGVGLVVVLATIGLAPFLPLVRRALGVLPAALHPERLLHGIKGFVQFSGGSHRRPMVLIATLLSVGAWFCDAAMIFFVARALQIQLDPAEAILISAVTVLSTAIPSAPGYVGTYELAAVTIATALGVPSGPALAMAVLAHALAIVPSAVGGALSAIALGINWRSVSDAAVVARARASAEPDSTLAPER